MNLLSTPEFKVGAMVFLVSALIAAMSLGVSEDPSYLASSKEAWFLIEDASGLVKKSNVKMAGINVGIIKDVRLENGMARIDMVIRSEVPVTKSARIEIRPNGILGDKHVEIVAGDPRDPPLRNGDQIVVVDDRASVDRLIGEVSKITKSLTTVADNIKAATEGDTEKPLGKIIANIEQITGDIAEFTKERKGQIGEIVSNIHSITGSIDDLISDESDEGFKAAWKDALKSLKRIEKSLANVEEITDKINRGEGTIGKLVNDETTVEELNTAIAGVSTFLDAANKIQTSVDFHSTYLTASDSTKSTLSLNIQPGLDRYYEIGIVDDPIGTSETVVTKTTFGNGAETEITEQKRFRDRVKLNVLLAKNFYNFTVKGGVIENSGGVGFDYFLLKRSLRLSLEAFDFGETNLRASAKYSFFKGIYVLGGGENLVSPKGKASAFVGGGIFLTNDDLKLFVSRLPF